jgi:hypothetical protein
MISWPLKPPTKSILDRAIQVRYKLVQGNDELCTVTAQNTWRGEEPYVWRMVPSFLRVILQQIFWRKSVRASLYTEGCKNMDLKWYLHYLELTLDAMWEMGSDPANITEIPTILRQWMTSDCMVGPHSSGRI